MFLAQYLKSLSFASDHYLTKKLGFGLNFNATEVLGSEIWRFLSYQACKIDILKGFSTVFSPLKKLQSPSRQQCSSHIKITDPQV